MLKRFLEYLRTEGWTVQMNDGPSPGFPEPVKSRYPSLPGDWLEFIAAVKCLTSADAGTWFLCADDYGPQKSGGFSWNEWERLSLEAAGEDLPWRREITRFWDEHLPILLSVKGGYSYYALSMGDGSVVRGFEPEFEECSPAASSFDAFMEGVLSGRIEL